ncbi:MAG TPA: hypothetical protein DCQ92_14850 [Verrucomicrobia subdivision 3 bacterium]|jgi:hypothetical protein|nr:hypothetical protein [Limisphaerales bacterium]
MPDALTNPQLLRSLGKLARGLSALFWGLPAALLVSAETARAEWLKPLGFLPALAVNALLVYGLWQMGDFQKQERPWRNALDRAQLLALVIFGLCPFIYWHNKMPEQIFFSAAVAVLELSAVLFLFNLNLVLKRLGAMLPDETLRSETRQFTALNRWLLVALLFFAIAFVALIQLPHPSLPVGRLLIWLNRASNLLLIFFILLPLAMTMALIWKTKEVILDAVFGSRQ